jgi:hypothetical protein
VWLNDGTGVFTLTQSVAAGFVATPLTGTALLVYFHTYTGAGVYTVTLSVSDGMVTDILTRTNYITATGGTVYTTTRVITYTYECAAALKQGERDKLYA